MKNRHFILLLSGLFFAIILGCSSSGTVNQNDEQKISSEHTWTLKDHLRRQAGVRMTGTGSATRVIIRGETSTNSPTNQPLFIIDGQKVGHSFANADELLYEGEIKSLKVLPPSKSIRYGMEGHYGVVVIYTK